MANKLKTNLDRIQSIIKDESIIGLFKKNTRSPLYYWYTGQKKVAIISWGLGLVIPIFIFLIALLTGSSLFILLNFRTYIPINPQT